MYVSLVQLLLWSKSAFDSVLLLVLDFNSWGHNLSIGLPSVSEQNVFFKLVFNNTALTTPSAPFMSSMTSPILHNARSPLSLCINTIPSKLVTLFGNLQHVWCSLNSVKYSWFQQLQKCSISVWMYFIFLLVTTESLYFFDEIRLPYTRCEGVKFSWTSSVYRYPGGPEFIIPSITVMIVMSSEFTVALPNIFSQCPFDRLDQSFPEAPPPPPGTGFHDVSPFNINLTNSWLCFISSFLNWVPLSDKNKFWVPLRAMNLLRLLTKLVAEQSGTIAKWTAHDLSMSENIGFTNTDLKYSTPVDIYWSTLPRMSYIIIINISVRPSILDQRRLNTCRMSFITIINPFFLNTSFLTPWKQTILRFSDVFRG